MPSRKSQGSTKGLNFITRLNTHGYPADVLPTYPVDSPTPKMNGIELPTSPVETGKKEVPGAPIKPKITKRLSGKPRRLDFTSC